MQPGLLRDRHLRYIFLVYFYMSALSVRGNASGDNPFPGLAKSGQISKLSAEAG